MSKKVRDHIHTKKGLKAVPGRKKFSVQEKENLASRMIDAGQLDEAEMICRNLVARGSDSAMTFHLLGVIALRKNQPGEAAVMLKKSLRINPDDPVANLRMGMALYMQGDHAGAIDSYKKTLALHPTNPYAYFNLGHVYFSGKSWRQAASAYSRAVKYKPDYFEAYNNLGVIYREVGRLRDALDNFDRAVEINPKFADAFYNLGGLWTRFSQLDKAEEYFRRACELNPEHQDAVACLAGILEMKGQKDEAFTLLEPLVKSSRLRSYLVVENYAKLCSNAGKFDEAVGVLEKYKLCCGDSLMARKSVFFSLGHVYDRMHRYDDAFENFRRANDIRAGIFSYEKKHEGWNRVKEVFSGNALPTSCNESILPVFILGLPRSGTSLAEQILASHPMVTGGGELEVIKQMVEELPSLLHTDIPAPDNFSMLTSEILDNLAEQYLVAVENKKQDDRITRVTDKMPGNFMFVGFIHLLFPQAKIIHCTRNPLDTCLSLYINDFRKSHAYRNRLTTLGEYYCDYHKLMDFWKNEMDIEMFELSYEKMVGDQEGMTRALVDYCGLECDESCLDFHESDRLVFTASYEQVRKPMYSTSVDRWRNYEKYLQPLIEILEKNHILERNDYDL